jgi:hypothetical protein
MHKPSEILKKRVRVASSLDVSDYQQLEQIARRLDEPVSIVVRRLLQNALQDETEIMENTTTRNDL